MTALEGVTGSRQRALQPEVSLLDGPVQRRGHQRARVQPPGQPRDGLLVPGQRAQLGPVLVSGRHAHRAARCNI